MIRKWYALDKELRLGNIALELWRLQGLKSTLLERSLIGTRCVSGKEFKLENITLLTKIELCREQIGFRHGIWIGKSNSRGLEPPRLETNTFTRRIDKTHIGFGKGT